MTRPLVSSALLALLTACAGARPIDRQSESQVIRELDQRWNQAVAAKDVATSAAFYADDGVFLPPNGPQLSGREAIRASWEDMLKLPNVALTFAPTKIEIASAGDLAYDIGTYRFGFDGPQGRVEDDGKYLEVWKKANGEWKVAADMFNSNRPLPGQK